MSDTQSASALVDRGPECELLEGRLAAARAGEASVLLLRGETGIGKTALLEFTIDSAVGMSVLSVSAIESEFDLPFAALQRLLAPLAGRIEDLPSRQRDALNAAVGLSSEGSADRFLVALAVLTLLADAADEAPLLCAVDDIEWLDEASADTLAFVAHRLESERLFVLLTAGHPFELGARFIGLPELQVDGLARVDSRELLRRAAGSRLDTRVGERLIGELGGNPLALLELTKALSPAQLSGSSPLPEALPLSARLEQRLLRNVRELPAETQSFLLLVAAERSGEPDLLWRAADRLGVERTALAPAESVLRAGEQITFRHGLVRAAVYASAAEGSRREAHLALAYAMDPVADAYRAAWHNAKAATGPDEPIAAELERSAEVARNRGGYSAAGAFLQLAAELTPDARRQATRLLSAAEALLAAGALDKASLLLVKASAAELDELQRAHARRLGAQISFARGENGHTLELLGEAARDLEQLDPWAARATYLQQLTLAMFAGRLAPSEALPDAARAALAAPSVPESHARPTDLLVDAFGLLFTKGHSAAAPALKRAIETSHDRGTLDEVGPAYQAAFESWDDEGLHALATRRVESARGAGALLALPNALSQLGTYQVMVGQFELADATFEEGRGIAAATGNQGILGGSDLGGLFLAAWRGDAAKTTTLAHACAIDGAARGVGTFVGFARYALSILELGLGRYTPARIAARDAGLDTLMVTRALPELVEAAARSGDAEAATEAVTKLAESTSASGTHWGLGILARSRALVATDPEELYLEAIDHLQHCRVVTQLARARLLYGEWLRRARRRRDAREELRAACELFEAMGALAFAARAATELAATGETIGPRTPTTVQTLTAHELRIATLAGEGATNSEIASKLFISPRTVEYHLGKVFRKLGISSRVGLTQALARRGG